MTTTVPLIEVYPNPSFGKTNLLIHNPSRKKMNVILTDNVGRIIWQSGDIENTVLWRKDFNPEASGIYFISLLSNGQISNKKFVIIQ